MFIIGTILADVDVRTIINKTTAGFGIFRLVLLPGAALALSRLLGLDSVAAGVGGHNDRHAGRGDGGHFCGKIWKRC